MIRINKTSEQLNTHRKSNIELLRIIITFGIVMYHIVFHSNIEYSSVVNINTTLLRVILTFGKVGVNLFILISGYFLLFNEQTNYINKLFNIWIIVQFYSIILALISYVIDKEISDIIAFPICGSQWWYYSQLSITLCILHLFRKSKMKLSSNTKLIICILLVIVCSIIPTILNVYKTNVNLPLFISFIMLILIGNFIKENVITGKGYKAFIYFILYTVTMCIFISITNYIAYKGIVVNLHGTYTPYYYDMNYFGIVIMSIFIFMIFLNINIDSTIINKLSQVTFDIYLISDSKLVRENITSRVFKDYIYSDNMILILFLYTVIIYITCSIIGMVRIHIFRWMSSIVKGCSNKYER